MAAKVVLFETLACIASYFSMLLCLMIDLMLNSITSFWVKQVMVWLISSLHMNSSAMTQLSQQELNKLGHDHTLFISEPYYMVCSSITEII